MLKLLALLVLLGAGGVYAIGRGKPPTIPTAAPVDLPRFMGDWYVIANIPTFIEKDACEDRKSVV